MLAGLSVFIGRNMAQVVNWFFVNLTCISLFNDL